MDIPNTKDNQILTEQSLPILYSILTIVFLALIIQFEAIYTYSLSSSEFILLSDAPYLSRWAVRLLGGVGIGLSFHNIDEIDWTIPDSTFHRFVLLSPWMILMFDLVMVMLLLD